MIKKLIKKYEKKVEQMEKDNSFLTDEKTYNLLLEILFDLRRLDK